VAAVQLGALRTRHAHRMLRSRSLRSSMRCAALRALRSSRLSFFCRILSLRSWERHAHAFVSTRLTLVDTQRRRSVFEHPADRTHRSSIWWRSNERGDSFVVIVGRDGSLPCVTEPLAIDVGQKTPLMTWRTASNTFEGVSHPNVH
jgi:hypothetical protein